jgi:hypothetical protein
MTVWRVGVRWVSCGRGAAVMGCCALPARQLQLLRRGFMGHGQAAGLRGAEVEVEQAQAWQKAALSVRTDGSAALRSSPCILPLCLVAHAQQASHHALAASPAHSHLMPAAAALSLSSFILAASNSQVVLCICC